MSSTLPGTPLDESLLDEVAGGSLSAERSPNYSGPTFHIWDAFRPPSAGTLNLTTGSFVPHDWPKAFDDKQVRPVCYTGTPDPEHGFELSRGIVIPNNSPAVRDSADRMFTFMRNQQREFDAGTGTSLREQRSIVNASDGRIFNNIVVDQLHWNEKGQRYEAVPGRYPDGTLRTSEGAPNTALQAIEKYGCDPALSPRSELEQPTHFANASDASITSDPSIGFDTSSASSFVADASPQAQLGAYESFDAANGTAGLGSVSAELSPAPPLSAEAPLGDTAFASAAPEPPAEAAPAAEAAPIVTAEAESSSLDAGATEATA